MAEITIKLFANLREFAGMKEIKLEGTNVKEILKALCKKFPGIDKMILKDDKLMPYINVFVNGEDVFKFGGMETPLRAGDEIAIFPPVSGG